MYCKFKIMILFLFLRHGVRNSLLLAPMPTASTAQILGNNESFEPYTNNIYSRRVLSGEFQVVNKHLLRDLSELNLWDDDMKNTLIAHNGSVQVCKTLNADCCLTQDKSLNIKYITR